MPKSEDQSPKLDYDCTKLHATNPIPDEPAYEGTGIEATNPYYAMNEDREEHLLDLKAAFSGAIDTQYRKGQREHGGDLQKKACFPRARPEVIDLFTYMYGHEMRMRKWHEVLAKVERALENDDLETASHIVALVRYELLQELSPETAQEVFDQ